MSKVLLVEDAPEFQYLVKEALGPSFNVTVVDTVSGAHDLIGKKILFDVILLDVQLPDGDGFHLCADIRNQPGMENIPILFLTLQSDVKDRVMGLTIGADDYITKPFYPNELRARVNARIRRRSAIERIDESIDCADLRLNISTQSVSWLRAGVENRIKVTPLEFRILRFFVQCEGRILTRAQLLNSVWGNSYEVTDRVVDRHVSALRKKIAMTQVRLTGVYSTGYLFEKTVT